ncbi:hypothetical protein THIAE_10135 [Thiomicrospira aerophila AL3]|uniref:PBP domain-containing protein n=1 Tax=Thiomicrospira aerophila AL3 TaxID=717772 RepID=W0DYJ7_9GAMM|nr:hypothetical protein THIAE_10135 [Thiomicrospira aerophila AL3]
MLLVNQPDAKSILADDLVQIYMMRQRVWPSGEPIHVFRLPSRHPIHITFVKDQLDIETEELERVWSRLVFSGRGNPPRVVTTEGDMVRAVLSTPGAIGYVSYDLVRGIPDIYLRDIVR